MAGRNSRARGRFVLGTMAALVASVTAGQAHCESLATQDQLDLDKTFARIFNRADFQDRMHALEGQLAGSKIAKRDGAGERIRVANAAVVAASLQLLVADDPERPRIYWNLDSARRWHGIEIPFSGWVLNNPDNIYRMAPIDGVSSYVIRGQLDENAPTQPSFFLFNCVPGDGSPNIDIPIGGVRAEDLVVAPDGSFTITVDPDPAGDRANHIRSRADARMLLIRETLVDWSTENPAGMAVERVAGPPPAPFRSDAEIMGAALQFARAANSMWIDNHGPRILALPVNTVEKLRGRGGNWGYLAAGNFRLARDEALVVTVDDLGAEYTGFQLGDVWGIPLDYAKRTGSLTNAQARANADGTFTYVISARDPGVYNWLDTGGLLEGTFLLRWQIMPGGEDPAQAIRTAEVTRLPDLAAATPDELKVDAKMRARQRLDRARDWSRRLR